jgi:radical SAM superfamily enzyme YgiQ (UPF0313 family)
MKVLLATLNARYTHSSLALAYLQAACRDPRWELIKREFTINDKLPGVLAEIYRIRPQVLCLSSYIWNIRQIVELCNDYRQLDPNCIMVLGGPEVSFDSRQFLAEHPAIDIIVRGEGELTLKKLLLHIYEGRSYAELKGISFRDQEQVRVNDAAPLIDDISAWPRPYSGDMSFYQNKLVYYETSRGCPFNCSYCISSTIKGVRFLPLERVQEDLSFLIRHRVNKIKFVDRTFNSHEKRALAIMQYILDEIGEERTTSFHFEICADLLSEAALAFLEQVPPGVFDFEIGVQSTCPLTLKAINRLNDWEKLACNVKKIKSYGNIHLHLDLIAGLPYEDYQRFGQSFNQVFELQADVIQLGFLKLLKGSPIYQEKDRYGYKFQRLAPYQVLANNYMDYQDLCRLQDIEELVEHYYNSGIFTKSLDYLVNRVYLGNAFKALEDFSLYWRRQGWYERPQARDSLYISLACFVKEKHPAHFEWANEWFKYDYLLNNRVYKVPDALPRYKPEEARQKMDSLLSDKAFLEHYLPEFCGKSLRELKKYVYLEYLNLNQDQGNRTYHPVLFLYHPGKQKSYKSIIVHESDNN